MSKANRFFKTPANNIKFLETQIFLGVGRVSNLNFSNGKNKNYGFSLIEMIVVVAIMAVLVVVLAPALLQYNERSRAEKDNSSMDEVVNAVQLALADPGVYDEVMRFSTVDNISCYVDTNSEANYQKVVTKINPDGVDQYTFLSDARQLDETPYFAAGNMRGVTITFAPNKGSNGSIYDLKQGVINQYIQVSDNQRVGAMPELYNHIRSVVGDEIFNNSQTYRNSEYTIFIRLGTTGGNDAAKQDSIQAYGQWSGTNLPAAVSYQLVQDRIVGDTGNTIADINDNKWNAENGNKVTINPGDLNGGGSFDISTTDGNKADVGIIYAYLTDDNTLILRDSPRNDMTNIVKDYGLVRQGGAIGSDPNPYRNWQDDAETIETVIFETKIYPTKMYHWFWKCSNLTNFEHMENLDTKYVDDMHGVFRLCNSLEYVDVSRWDTGNVKNFNCLFEGCGKLKSLDVGNWNVKNVRLMKITFTGCSSLTKLDLSKWNTESCENMTYMFQGCTSLKNLNISNFNTSKVIDMAYMFQGMKNIETIDCGGFDTSKCTDMRCMFQNCNKLKYINCGNFDTSNVTNMEYMFNECHLLEMVDVSNFDTANVTNMLYMFDQCEKLKVIDVSNWNTSKVTNMGAMFANCYLLEEIEVSGFDTSNVTNMMHMFHALTKVQQIDVGGFDTSNVTNMYCMFYNCKNVEYLDLSNFDTSNVTNMYCMFQSCNKLNNIDLSNWEVSKVTTMESMFQHCYKLESLNLSSWTPTACETYKQMFGYCYALTTIGNVDHWPVTAAQSSGQGIFAGSTNLNKLPTWHV